jgi:hypothetical protein
MSIQELLDDWQPISTAPYGVDLEVAVVNGTGTHAVVFPCRRVVHGWINGKTRASTEIRPTHWRQWDDSFNPLFVHWKKT